MTDDNRDAALDAFYEPKPPTAAEQAAHDERRRIYQTTVLGKPSGDVPLGQHPADHGAMQKPLEEYELEVLVGGNHLASVLHVLGVKDVAATRTYTYDDMIRDYGTLAADTWVAWRAILAWRDAKERLILRCKP